MPQALNPEPRRECIVQASNLGGAGGRELQAEAFTPNF